MPRVTQSKRLTITLNPIAKRWILLTLLALGSAGTAEAKSILVVGDSLSAGYGIDPQLGWVHRLQTRLDQTHPGLHQVINASVSGETSSGGLARLPKLLATYRPDVVIIELGGNDGLRGQPPAILQSNLERMVTLSQTSKAKVLIWRMRSPQSYGTAYSNAFRESFKRVASRQNVAFVPFFLDGVAGHAELIQADGIHPKAGGKPRMLDNVYPAIRKFRTKNPAIKKASTTF